MKNRLVAGLFVLAGAGVFFISNHSPFKEDSTNSQGTAKAPTPTQPTEQEQAAVATPDRTGNQTPAVPRLAPSPLVLWDAPTAEPPFVQFADWVQRYRKAPTAEAKASLETEGVALAQVRLRALADLIQANPEHALEVALPRPLRHELPEAVQNQLEHPVNTRGDYHVLAVYQGQGGELPPVIRSAKIDGKTYEAFTYGQQLQFVSRTNVPLNGIAVPAAASSKPAGNALLHPEELLALGPPGRFLDSGEVEYQRQARPQEPVCSISGQLVTSRGEETAVELGGVIHSFCGVEHAQQWVIAGVAAAGLDTPGGDVPVTAESTYTEGRKRMLLMRPIWSNYTTGMTTNQALSHFASFSNYMFEMSYGKLVLAGLGRGSDVTPPMVLPGVVSDYDNTGLGLLYNTCRSVAESNYGYDLTQYDFTYVCTAGSPAAGYCGLGNVGSPGFHLALSCWDAATVCHEFGHNLGLNHAHFWDAGGRTIIGGGQNVEYGDVNDPMGSGGSPNAYNSRYKNYLGWIHDSDVADLNSTGSGRYRLYAFDVDNSVGLRGMKFRRNASQNYWLNFRQRKTSKRALMNGLQVMWTGNGNEGSYVLDTRLIDNADDNALVIGRTFSDPSLGFHVTPLGKGHTSPESLDVQINIGSFPANLPPTVNLTAGPLNTSPGQTISFAANATDPNGDSLAYFWDFGDGDYSVENQPTALHSFASTGDFAVQCTVSDMKGGAARQTVLVRVGSPTTFRISGHVVDRNSRPLVGMRVSATGGAFADTDSDGSYTLVGLSAGTYNLEANEPVAGSMVFLHPSFNGSATVGPNFTTADFVGVPNSLILSTPLVAKAATWRYLNNGTDQGTAWRAGSFNDSGWSSGVAPLGYPSGSPITTVIGYGPDPNNKYITYYFRKQFTVANPSAYTDLKLEVLRDDGVVVYLNGSEIFRDNMPAGSPTYLTPASSALEAQDYLESSVNTGLLLNGVNTFAVEVHQSDRASSDVVFDTALTGMSLSNIAGLNLTYLSGPPDHAGITSPTNVTLSAFVYAGTGAVSVVQFYVDGGKIGEAAAAPYTALWSSPANGPHLLSAVATIGSALVTSPPVNVTVSSPSVPPTSLALIASHAVWKYLAGPTSAPANWNAPGFNDGSWPSGPAQLGYGDGDEATVIPYGGVATNKWITYYFRRAFVVNDPGAITNLVVSLLRDDGGVVYLNGVEVFRSNMPDGAISYSTLAFDAVDDGAAYFDNLLNPDQLRPGTNVMAVEIHQAAATSSDVSFDLSLNALVSTNRSRGLWITAPTNGSALPLPSSPTVTAQVVAGSTLGVNKVEFFSDGVKIGESAGVPFTATWTNPPGGIHALTAVATDTAGGTISSAPVNVNLGPMPLGTALISFGDVWKYRDDGANLGTGWSLRTYNDSQWMAGPGRLGYGFDGEETRVSYGTNVTAKYITTYFRKPFSVASPSAFTGGLWLRLIRDDGAAVYLNGVEIFRNNLQPGPVSWNSLATAAVEGAAETTPVDVLLGTAGLLTGNNELAVEVHQVAANSSDLGFDLALVGLTATNTAQGVYLASPANGAHFNLPDGVGLSAAVVAPDTVTLVQYFDGPTLIGQATVDPYVATWSGAPVGSHTLTAVVTYGAGLQMTSPPVTIAVSAAPPLISPIFTTLASPGGSWRYWDSATPVSSGWQQPSFNDSAWPSANARFGWGLDGELTPLTPGRVTHYFRRWFVSANGALFTDLNFELIRDDGAVVYLNGVEIFRSNMPPGPVSAGTLALTTVNTPDETTWFETVLASAGSGLQSGSNLLAVELHQASAGSSDGSFDFALYGEGTSENRFFLSSPVNNASIIINSPIVLEALGSPAPGLTVSKVEFFADGNKIGEALTPPYRMTWNGAALGTHVLFARLTDTTGGELGSSFVNINITHESVTTTLISSNAVWKYLDTGSNQGTNWSRLGFNDNAWSSGPARLGFGGDGEATVLHGQPVVTYYFRKTFVAPAGVTFNRLDFNLVRDDGAVVWLNGREAYRSNMAAGPVLYNTPAAGSVSGADEQTFFQTSISITNLLAGTNLVAVEVHQVNSGSTDIGFNLELIGNGFLESTTPPTLTATLADDMVELSWPATASGWQAISAPTVDTPGNTWTPVPGTPIVVNGRYVLTVAPTGAQKFFRLSK